ncbi:MAG: WYL domain-containing protein [Vicinamibacterales bacterium]
MIFRLKAEATNNEDWELEAVMARNAELVRQWEILRDIDSARNGITVPKLAALRLVHQRTIRRDIDAICRAGFPLYDDKVNGTTMWKMQAKPFRSLEETGLSVTELCALYFGRTMVATLAGTPFHDDMDRALVKIERALPRSCRRFLDALPVTVKAKATGRKKQNRKVQEMVTRAADAALNCRRISMGYYSASSRRAKQYVVEPLRLVYADGGVYLIAWVPEYGEMRTFAAERIQTLEVLDGRFTPRPQPTEPFADSLGVNTGIAELVEIEFDATTAEFIADREWHPSQEIEPRSNGSVLLRLHVCVDRPLLRWILGFGPAARVLYPDDLAQTVFEHLDAARERYAVRPRFAMARMSVDDVQPQLPWKVAG